MKRCKNVNYRWIAINASKSHMELNRSPCYFGAWSSTLEVPKFVLLFRLQFPSIEIANFQFWFHIFEKKSPPMALNCQRRCFEQELLAIQSDSKAPLLTMCWTIFKNFDPNSDRVNENIAGHLLSQKFWQNLLINRHKREGNMFGAKYMTSKCARLTHSNALHWV